MAIKNIMNYFLTDFLASSMTSTKTVCSDAFDFLFDEKNLNPEKVLEEEFQSTMSEAAFRRKMAEENGAAENDDIVKPVQQSSCCVIS